MRRLGVAALAFLFVPSGGAVATQDDLVNGFLDFGDNDLFASYPTLLELKALASTRLQSTANLNAAELAAFEDLLNFMKSIETLDQKLDVPSYDKLTDAYQRIATLRNGIQAINHPATTPLRDLLRFAGETLLERTIAVTESFADTHPRTAERIALLRSALAASELVQDALAYSRLDGRVTDLDVRYQRDTRRAQAAVRRAESLLDDLPAYLSLQFPRHYADLIEARDNIRTASTLFERHGETENVVRADELETDLDDRIGSLGSGIALVLTAYALVLFLIAAWAMGRIVRWANHHRMARWGDEIAFQV